MWHPNNGLVQNRTHFGQPESIHSHSPMRWVAVWVSRDPSLQPGLANQTPPFEVKPGPEGSFESSLQIHGRFVAQWRLNEGIGTDPVVGFNLRGVLTLNLEQHLCRSFQQSGRHQLSRFGIRSFRQLRGPTLPQTDIKILFWPDSQSEGSNTQDSNRPYTRISIKKENSEIGTRNGVL